MEFQANKYKPRSGRCHGGDPKGSWLVNTPAPNRPRVALQKPLFRKVEENNKRKPRRLDQNRLSKP